MAREAVGLYIHVPFCRSKCAYCGFFSEPIDGHDSTRLMGALKQELSACADTPQVKTAYIGGGSPTSLPPDQLTDLARTVTRLFPDLEEFTVECNPDQADAGLFNRLRACGVNRLSIGVQSFEPAQLRTLGRSHPDVRAHRAVDLARQRFDNVGLDLIFAIPGTSLQSWENNLIEAIRLDPQHISVYALTLEPGTPLARAAACGEITPIDETLDRDMYKQAMHLLQSAGFIHYEISNFARPGFACRHNLGYWQHRPYIGVGPGAASFLNHCRIQNIEDISAYETAIEDNIRPIKDRISLSLDDHRCERAVLNLRMRRGIHLPSYQRATGVDALTLFSEPIRRYQDLGLLAIQSDRLFLTEQALPVADSILCDFSSP